MTVSPSVSAFVAVAVSVAVVEGAAGASVTVALGAVFAIVTAVDVDGVELAVPSFPVTRTEIVSAFEPLPVTERLSVAAVSPARSTPFLRH